jgi:hypothetical protein
MSLMIDRVALAMQLACEGPMGDFERGHYTRPHETYVKCARAALEEMREPTVEMIYAVGSDYGPALEDNWKTMIDGALK